MHCFAAGVFSRCAQTTPLTEQQEVLLPSFFSAFSVWGGHRNTARQAMDGLWTEVCGQQKQSNDPGNNQHILNTPIIGRR